MQFILDHITGVVIAAIVIMIVAVTQFRGSEVSIEANQYAAAKTRMLNVVEFVEQDFANIGSGVDPVSGAIQNLDSVSTVKEFQFLGRTSQGDPAVYTILYRWTETGSVVLANNVTVPTYTVERRIDGAVSGTSMGTVTEFRVDLMAADSTVVTTNYQDTRLVGVFLKATSPLGVSKGIEQTRWQKVFRPVNLTRE
jgi:predicted ABC-type sugar transport system permease subunit